MKIRTKLFLILFIFTCLIIGVMSYSFYRDIVKTKFEEIRAHAVSIASSAVVLIDEQKHSKLLKPEDMKSKEYLEIQNNLRNFQKCFPQVHYIYTMVKTEKPNIWKFVVDASEPRDKDGDGKISKLEDTTPLGEEYDVSKYAEMQRAFEGPIADKQINCDKWGCWLSAYAPIYNSSGVPTAIVGIDISAQTIQIEKDKLKKKVSLIFGLFVVISLIASWVLSNPMTRAITKITEATKLISKGKYDTVITEKRNDEIGELITSINEMSKNIKRAVDKLKTLNRTSEILATILDLEEALKLSMNLLLEILNASKGMILLLNRTEDIFSLGISNGIETEVKIIEDKLFIEGGKISFKADSKFVEYIKTKPDVYTISELEKIPQLSQAKKWFINTGMMSFIPLIVKQELVGCLLLDIKTEDKEFFNTLTNQIAMFLENARLYHEAIVDGLTELYDHKYFQLQLLAEIKRSQRFNRVFSVLMMDIDYFKNLNDTYGHQAGDFVLKETATLIKLLTRKTDIVARYGGEEIAIILPETNINSAKTVAEKIRSEIEAHQFNWQDKVLKITVSIGIAEWSNENPISAEMLIKFSDVALYKAKKAGRNKVCV